MLTILFTGDKNMQNDMQIYAYLCTIYTILRGPTNLRCILYISRENIFFKTLISQKRKFENQKRIIIRKILNNENIVSAKFI